MSYLSTLVREGKFIMPSQAEIERMDLIDVRRKLMKFCDESQGAIGPCRSCMRKCAAGKWAIQLYDRLQVPKTEEPEVTKNNSEENETAKQNVGKVAQWYIDATASADPVDWCVNKFGISRQKAKKKIYMYEYNHFRTVRTSNTDTAPSKPRSKKRVSEGPTVKVDDDDFSLMSDLQEKMKILTRRKEECDTELAYHQSQVEKLTAKKKKIVDQIDAVSMCLELFD